MGIIQVYHHRWGDLDIYIRGKCYSSAILFPLHTDIVQAHPLSTYFLHQPQLKRDLGTLEELVHYQELFEQAWESKCRVPFCDTVAYSSLTALEIGLIDELITL